MVDALEPAVKEELIQNICSKELNAYQQIFQGTGKARVTFGCSADHPGMPERVGTPLAVSSGAFLLCTTVIILADPG